MNNLNNFTYLYLAFMLLSLFYLRIKINPRSIPNIMTTLGVLGTFIGIVIGLYSFDVNAIKESVPDLLAGLKFAFLTSIAGISVATFIKIYPRVFFGKLLDISKAEGATLDTLVDRLELINSNQELYYQDSIIQLEKIERSLTGEGESTLITQIQKLRTTFIDKQDELNKSFKEFADKMVEDNTSALIDALTKVMEDFNARLNEYIGDNFKKLNEGIGLLLEWQDNYKEQVATMTEQFEKTLKAIDTCEKSLSEITAHSEAFTEISKELDNRLVQMYDITEDLSNQLEAFAKLAESAQNAFPIIENNLKQLTENFFNSVEKSISENRKMLDNQKLQFDSLTDQGNKNIQVMRESIQKSHENINSEIRKMLSDTSSQIKSMVDDTSKNIANQIKVLDDSMGEEFNKSIKTLGEKLSALSMKFVSDYTPLTDRLRDVLTIAEGIKNDRQ